jgi:hypothetical protein
VNVEQGLCASCLHAKLVESSKRASFVLCQLSYTDSRLARCPRLLVLVVTGTPHAVRSIDTEGNCFDS